MIITDINQLDFEATYTVEDYLSWQFYNWVQLVNGKVYKLLSLSEKAARASKNIVAQLLEQLPKDAPYIYADLLLLMFIWTLRRPKIKM